MLFRNVQFYPQALAQSKSSITASARLTGGTQIPKYWSDVNDVREQYLQSPFFTAFREHFITNEIQKPVITYDDIRGSIPYNDGPTSDITTFNQFNKWIRNDKCIHIGQRKLFISELQSLNAVFDNFTDTGIIIYAGSAPSMKLWVMMQLYPNVIFLLVDPNEFNIYDGKYDLPHYIRQDNNYIDGGEKWDVYTDRDERIANAAEYVYLSYSDSNMYESRIYKYKNILLYDTKTHQLVKHNKPFTNSGYGKAERRINQHLGEFNMLSPRANQESIDYVFAAAAAAARDSNSVAAVRGGSSSGNNDRKSRGSHRVFFIEEYFTDNIAEMIGNASARYPGVKTAFWSDIRTNMDMDGAPKDLDILLNTAWTYSWLRLIKPTTSMLKFRCPFFNESLDIDFSKFKDSFDSAANLGYDFRTPTWKEDKFYFFGGPILLQAWCGPNSTETRLIVSRDEIVNNKLKCYSLTEYENKFYFYNMVERYSVMHENPNANPNLGFDHCNDCAIENSVWTDYKKRNPLFNVDDGIAMLDRVLHVPILDRGEKYGHGHLFPNLTMADFKRNVDQSDYIPSFNR